LVDGGSHGPARSGDRSQLRLFPALAAQLLPEHRGEFALLRKCGVVHFYRTPFEAELAGEEKFSDGLYSIQEVTEAPADLGFFTHAFDKDEARQ
jgi:hypothetical protein